MQVLSVDTHPVEVADRYVEPVDMGDIPAELRAHAASVLDERVSGSQWWTLGKFLDDGETLSDTAVARLRRDAGRMVIVYGVECV